MKPHSILNDVLGPVMAGPSSSHTAAPAKIGFAVRELWGGPIRAARVVYDEAGSYPSTHVGQGSDFGFAGGLLGMKTSEACFRESLRLAKERGMEITFAIGPLDARHPNEARIDVLDGEGGRAFSALSFSTGGGTFLIPEMDGFAVEYDGQRWSLTSLAKHLLGVKWAMAGPKYFKYKGEWLNEIRRRLGV